MNNNSDCSSFPLFRKQSHKIKIHLINTNRAWQQSFLKLGTILRISPREETRANVLRS